ncbi:hypothetical protein [Rummeliibacillus pycnus]|uniref:hypothetical protein n=1 Tax=Rummeliibacillus pycnus TaxID=101070 RepID=UPI000C9B5F0E|nr:hypothetical protein [Rummeliibacillus pycnus]
MLKNNTYIFLKNLRLKHNQEEEIGLIHDKISDGTIYNYFIGKYGEENINFENVDIKNFQKRLANDDLYEDKFYKPKAEVGLAIFLNYWLDIYSEEIQSNIEIERLYLNGVFY